jgi:hypothetical protein
MTTTRDRSSEDRRVLRIPTGRSTGGYSPGTNTSFFLSVCPEGRPGASGIAGRSSRHRGRGRRPSWPRGAVYDLPVLRQRGSEEPIGASPRQPRRRCQASPHAPTPACHHRRAGAPRVLESSRTHTATYPPAISPGRLHRRPSCHLVALGELLSSDQGAVDERLHLYGS